MAGRFGTGLSQLSAETGISDVGRRGPFSDDGKAKAIQ